MQGLKEMLLEEERRLACIIEKGKERLQNAPEGTLQVSGRKDATQYYYCNDDGEKTYIRKENQDIIQKLAQKEYDKRVLRFAEKRSKQIKRLTKDYEEDEIEKIYWLEHPEKRRVICPVEVPWEEQLKQWEEEIYTPKSFQEGTAVILTEKGERVRSKSEKIMADFFYNNGIPYKYEKTLYLKNVGIVYPDFTFLSPVLRKEIYWEHDGRMDDPKYAEYAVRKIHAYEQSDIWPGERLILTFETEKTILDIEIIKKLLERYDLM